MKKSILLFGFTFVLSCETAVSQVTIRENNIVEKPVQRPARFDSLSNIHSFNRDYGHNLKQYLEQEIFMIPMTQAEITRELDAKKRFQEANRKLDSLKSLSQKYKDSIELLKQKINPQNAETIRTQIVQLISKRTDLPLGHQEEYKSYNPYDRGIRGFYACDSSGNVKSAIPYIEIQNKYYTMVNIMEFTEEPSYGKISGSVVFPAKQFSSKLSFLLKQRDGNYVLWYFDEPKDLNTTRYTFKIDNYNTYLNIGLLTSYFGKNKALFEGKSFIATNSQTDLVDVSTGELVQVTPGSKWTCEELSLVSLENVPLMVPFFFLKNQAGETIKVPLWGAIRDTTRIDGFMTESRYLELQRLEKMKTEQRLAEEKKKAAAEQRRIEQQRQAREQFKQSCIEKWGQKNGSLIASGQVILGMNQEMCQAAWGKPSRVNRTIVAGLVHEQWVYGWHNYLYFENGILVSIQN